jgi:2-hydroxychromene-2-carboxylate isomerase
MIGAPVSETTFYYDFNSPYAYLAAHRVDEVLPVRADWRPIAFGALIRQIGKVPWSLQGSAARARGQRECEQRTAALGLPLRWPEGWPDRNYSIVVLRAALVAAEHDRLREFSLAAFRRGLGEGGDLRDLDTVLACARDAGIDADAVARGVEEPAVKQRLRRATDAALAPGVTGVATVAVGEELFWGEDRLEDAAAAALARG